MAGSRRTRLKDIAVPGDLAVVGYDDIEPASFCSVPLTTMHYGVEEVAERAVARLLELIDAKNAPANPQIMLIEPEIVVRESCGARLAGGG